jgi:hypothetical protein
VFDGQDFMGLGTQRIRNYFFANLNIQYSDRVFVENNTKKSQIEIYYPDLTSTGWCNQMISYNYLLKVWNPPRDVSNASMSCEAPVYSIATSTYDNASRTMVYSRGVANTALVQKDQGYTFINNTAIESEFQRNNIQLLKDYSGKLLVHRILPEVVNLDSDGLQAADSTGNITITIGGSNSVGQVPTFKAPVTITANTAYPWTQINQNAFRINTLRIDNTSNNSVWLCSATTWQYTQTEDDR